MIILLLAFVVPGPPVPKARARVIGRRAFTPAKTRAYQARVAWHAAAARGHVDRWPMHARMCVVVRVYRRWVQRGDADNYCKAILDACNGVLWADDRQVNDVRTIIAIDDAAPRVEVEVEATEESGSEATEIRA